MPIKISRAIEVICANPECKKVFLRQPHELKKSRLYFCSNSCSAKVNNTIRNIKRRKTSKGTYYRKEKMCQECNKKFYGINKRKYRSHKCANKNLCPPVPKIKVTKEQILHEIKEFYNQNGRIPLKREYFRVIIAR